MAELDRDAYEEMTKRATEIEGVEAVLFCVHMEEGRGTLLFAVEWEEVERQERHLVGLGHERPIVSPATWHVMRQLAEVCPPSTDLVLVSKAVIDGIHKLAARA